MGPKTQALARALFSRDGTYARAFDNLILMLILVSVVSVGLESIDDILSDLDAGIQGLQNGNPKQILQRFDKNAQTVLG